jgi:hypothetical protein
MHDNSGVPGTSFFAASIVDANVREEVRNSPISTSREVAIVPVHTGHHVAPR